MTGSALNLALKLVLLHVERENVKHGVLRDALVEVSETHWIGLKKLAYKHVNHNIVCAIYQEIPGGGGGIHRHTTYIRQK